MKHTLESALDVLHRAPGIVCQGKGISVTAGVVGIKVYGIIDYLVNYHHYHYTLIKKDLSGD